MNNFKNTAAQGDLLLRKIEVLPTDAVPTPPVDGALVLAHSETGHHHAIAVGGPSMVELFGSTDPLKGYLRVSQTAAELRHHRPFDTHATLVIEPGIYEVRRQREWTPEGWRRVAD